MTSEPRMLPVGWVAGRREAIPYLQPVSTLTKHLLFTGPTGGGKSFAILSLLLGLVTRYPDVGIVLIDPKSETAQTWLLFLETLADRYPHLRPDRLVTANPFGRWTLPCDPLAVIPGLSPEIQSSIVCSTVDGLVDGGLGQRAKGILSWLCRVAIALKANLLDVVLWLRDDSARRGAAGRLSDPELQGYLLHLEVQEPRASMDSLRSRLEWILLLPEVRAALCAGESVGGSTLLESPLTVADFGNAPLGFSALNKLFSSLYFQLLAAAILSRPVTPSTRPVIVVIDEIQEVIASCYPEVQRLLCLARARKVGLWSATQSLASLTQVSSGLVDIFTTNVALHIAFHPDATTIKNVLPYLPVTGQRIDPMHPDTLLSPEAERRHMVETIARLPPRHALVVDTIAGRAEAIRTLSLPIDEARQRAERLSTTTRDRWERGRLGRPMAELLRAAQSTSVPDEPAPAEPSPTDAPKTTARRRAASARPKLEVPS